MPAPRRPWPKNGELRADLCIIGAGSGGLSVAAGAAQMGAAVVLIEAHAMGGDCLNAGCVPSKSLLAAAHAAQAAREAHRFGVGLPPPRVDFGAVRGHVQGVIAAIAPHDSAERFEGLGCTVLRARAAFTGPDTLEAGGTTVRARRFVIATGSRPAIPAIPGLDAVPHLTSETVFGLAERPDHLIVLGGGPIGVEMAQAFRRLGAEVTLIERAEILPRDEPEAVALLRAALRREGVRVIEGAAVAAVNPGPEVEFDLDGLRQTLAGTHLLVATGRRPNVEGLGLEAAGVAHTAAGIAVDRGLGTSNRRIYAIGDVAGGPRFTHAAGYQAGIVIRRALFGLPARVDYAALPWVTYADPELAHVGMSEREARLAGEAVTVLTEPLSGNDRARAERAGEGLIKVVLGARGRVLGATILAPRAGELISLWGLAIQNRLKIGAVARMIAPYPTLSELSKRAAGGFYAPRLFSARMRAVVGFLQRVLP